MVKRRLNRFWTGVACLLVAWTIQALGVVFAVPAATSIPFWVPLVLLFAAGGLTAVSGVSFRSRAAVALTIVLVALALVSVGIPSRDAEGLEDAWRANASTRVAATLNAVADGVITLETVSSEIGASVTRLMVDSGAGGFDLFEIFTKLDSLAAAAGNSRALPQGTQIGIQLFSADGSRLAWAGWPQIISAAEGVYIDKAQELIFTRKVSLYRILSHFIPIRNGEDLVAMLLVDMPLEVDYRVNNRFLKSTSLADDIASGQVSSVGFEYFPDSGNLPDRLAGFKAALERTIARRDRILSRGDASAAPESLLTYYHFAKTVVPMAVISGSELMGLRGRVMVHAPQGNPVLVVTATSFPLRHFVELRLARWLTFARALLITALIVLFTFLMLRIPRSGRSIAGLRSGLLVAFLVLFRYALLSFRSTQPAASVKMFDPTIFATPVFGGLMRSPGDLLITAVFFVVTLYGIFKVFRSDHDEDVAGRAVPQRPYLTIPKALVMIAVIGGIFEVARRFTTTVVINANPRLLGETMRLTDPQVLVLHLSMFLMITGIVLTGIFAVWAMLRLTGWRDLNRVALIAALAIVIYSVITGRIDFAVVSLAITLFVVLAPRFVRREDLVSIVMVVFAFVIISSGTAYVFLSRDYDGLRKSFTLEKAQEIISPSDNWKVVILEDILSELSGRPELRQALRTPWAVDVQRLAFDLWAEGPLSLLGYSCAIHVISADDKVISEFAVDMPYRARISEGGERIDTPDVDDWVVLDLTRSTPQGEVRFYRGIFNVSNVAGTTPTGMPGHLGKVIIDLPFFFKSLALAARTGPRTPEVLRNVQQGTVAPRIEEPEALLLARVGGTQIYESSLEDLPLGRRIEALTFDRALESKWPILSVGDRKYRVVIRETEQAEQYLLAGFLVPGPQQHVLRWSTLFSLYLSFAFGFIVAIVVFGTMPYLKNLLPTLTPGRKLGFQQKLLASFLTVSLVPAIILGMFSANFIKDRFVEENRQEALYKAQSARKAFANLLRGELHYMLGNTAPEQLFSASGLSPGSVGEDRIVRLFNDGTFAGGYGVPDSLSVVGTLDVAALDDVHVLWSGGDPYMGVLSAPIRVTRPEWERSFYVYYARKLDATLLSEVAEQIGADVNVYDGGRLVASSREGLLAGGFISAIMNSKAFVRVSMLEAEHSIATETAGQYSYQVAYLPVASWGDGSIFGLGSPDESGAAFGGAYPVDAAMSVPLVFRPESYYLEVQKATSVVLGIFALLFAATIALGLFLARGIFEPLRGLLAGTRSISEGNFNVRLSQRSDDEIGTVVHAFNDMTEQIADSQRRLEERRRYLEAILQNVGTGVITTDENNRVRTLNSAAHRILGVDEEEVRDREVRELVDAGLDPQIFGLLESGKNISTEQVNGELQIKGDIEEATIKYMMTRLEVEGRYLGTVFVFEDLTELIQSKKLSAWVEMARQIAHEIKNPLTPIRISTQFMRRAYELKPDKFKEVFEEGTETILRQVDVLKRIAGEFSSYGRMQELKVSPHRLDPIIREIVSPYANNNAGVVISYENGHEDAMVVADPEAVRKICANLIENALEAMPEGGNLKVRFRELSSNGEPCIGVEFCDSGPGLNAEVAGRLFEPYFSTKTTGTGLGLAICRTLSHEMGGDIVVENNPDGAGVVATLKLKRKP